ncbi:hypothetical protein PR048_023304, partial [Dryococelus australis]
MLGLQITPRETRAPRRADKKRTKKRRILIPKVDDSVQHLSDALALLNPLHPLASEGGHRRWAVQRDGDPRRQLRLAEGARLEGGGHLVDVASLLLASSRGAPAPRVLRDVEGVALAVAEAVHDGARDATFLPDALHQRLRLAPVALEVLAGRRTCSSGGVLSARSGFTVVEELPGVFLAAGARGRKDGLSGLVGDTGDGSGDSPTTSSSSSSTSESSRAFLCRKRRSSRLAFSARRARNFSTSAVLIMSMMESDWPAGVTDVHRVPFNVASRQAVAHSAACGLICNTPYS